MSRRSKRWARLYPEIPQYVWKEINMYFGLLQHLMNNITNRLIIAPKTRA